jgi:AbrB family transcriptional regulator (stage V sporulation protein T)
MNEFIRRLDGLGRIVLPKEYRKQIKISDDSKLKISLEQDYIKIEKYSEINNNLDKLLNFKKILKKNLDLEILVTNLEEIIDQNIELNEEIIHKIKYGKVEILNNNKDILFNKEENINFIIIPIILLGEVIGSIIGYSYKKEIDDLDKKILEIAISILIKDIEE